MTENKNEFVPLSELQKKPEKADKSAFIDIKNLVDKEFVIYGAAFYNGTYGEYAVVIADCGYFQTSSRVLLKQLRAIQEAIEQKKLRGVRVRLSKRKSKSNREYYVFE
jgi:hypothetical protein